MRLDNLANQHEWNKNDEIFNAPNAFASKSDVLDR
jgi:hypothetical protein